MSTEPETYENEEQDWLGPDSMEVAAERTQRPDYAANTLPCESCQ